MRQVHGARVRRGADPDPAGDVPQVYRDGARAGPEGDRQPHPQCGPSAGISPLATVARVIARLLTALRSPCSLAQQYGRRAAQVTQPLLHDAGLPAGGPVGRRDRDDRGHAGLRHAGGPGAAGERHTF